MYIYFKNKLTKVKNLIFRPFRYLHVAVCKTDPNMVLALLERLMRENLSQMIDVENKHRQVKQKRKLKKKKQQLISSTLKPRWNEVTLVKSLMNFFSFSRPHCTWLWLLTSLRWSPCLFREMPTLTAWPRSVIWFTVNSLH